MLTRRAILARLFAVALLVGPIAVLAELHRDATPEWRSPALAATRRGLLLTWVQGPAESSAVRVRRIGHDLRPLGAARRLASVPPATQLALPVRGEGALLLVRPYMDAILLGALDEDGRPARGRTGDERSESERAEGDSLPRSERGVRGGLRPTRSSDPWPAVTAQQAEAEGLAPRSGLRRVPLGQPEYGLFPSSGACSWGRPWQAADVPGPGGRTVACVEPAAAGRAWRIRARGSRRELARLEGAHCPSTAEYGCVAAVERGGSQVVAWVRRGPLSRSFVLSRIGEGERVLDRELASTGVVGFGGVGLAVVILLLWAVGELWSLTRLLRALVPKQAAAVLSGQLRDCNFDPGRGWRMSVGPGCLSLEDGSSARTLPGGPLVVTLPALRGQLPRSARAVGLFEKVHVVGLDAPAEPPGDRAVRIELISDAPLAETRRTVRARLAIVAVDAAALLAVGWALFAVLGS